MTVRAAADRIVLEGDCMVEEAEQLLALIQDNAGVGADLSQCTYAHTAILQILLATGIAVTPPKSLGVLADFIVPALIASDG